jgi:hypothetical protein
MWFILEWRAKRRSIGVAFERGKPFSTLFLPLYFPTVSFTLLLNNTKNQTYLLFKLRPRHRHLIQRISPKIYHLLLTSCYPASQPDPPCGLAYPQHQLPKMADLPSLRASPNMTMTIMNAAYDIHVYMRHDPRNQAAGEAAEGQQLGIT